MSSQCSNRTLQMFGGFFVLFLSNKFIVLEFSWEDVPVFSIDASLWHGHNKTIKKPGHLLKRFLCPFRPWPSPESKIESEILILWRWSLSSYCLKHPSSQTIYPSYTLLECPTFKQISHFHCDIVAERCSNCWSFFSSSHCLSMVSYVSSWHSVRILSSL